MSTLTILSIVFVVLILMPFAVAGIYFFRSRGSVMFIRQDMVKDQRFFAHSFRKMIGRALPDAKDGKLRKEIGWKRGCVFGQRYFGKSVQTVVL